MSKALPEVFDRFSVGAARVAKKDFDALLHSDDLRGLPSVFSELKLLETKVARSFLRSIPGRSKRCSPGST